MCTENSMNEENIVCLIEKYDTRYLLPQEDITSFEQFESTTTNKKKE